MDKSQDALVNRIVDANRQIPATGCRAQHATHGGHHRATFEVHALDGDLARLAQGLFAQPRTYPAVIRYSNGAEQDSSKPDVHGMAIKVHADAGERLLTDPDEGSAIDFLLIDVDTFFSDDLSSYATINERLVPLLQRKQVSDDAFSGWDAMRGLLGTLFSFRTAGDALRLKRFRGEKKPVGEVQRWHLVYSSATPYKLGSLGPVKYKVLAAEENLGTDTTVNVTFCIELPRDPSAVNIEEPSHSWADMATTIPVATLMIETDPEGTADIDVERLRFNPWHVPPEHEPLGAINIARRKVYDTLASKRQKEQDGG